MKTAELIATLRTAAETETSIPLKYLLQMAADRLEELE